MIIFRKVRPHSNSWKEAYKSNVKAKSNTTVQKPITDLEWEIFEKPQHNKRGGISVSIFPVRADGI